METEIHSRAQLSAALSELAGPTDLEIADGPLDARLRVGSLGSLQLTEISLGPAAVLRRDERRLRDLSGDRLLLALQTRGSALLRQDGAQAPIGPGQGVLYRVHSTIEVTHQEAGQYLMLGLDQGDLRGLVGADLPTAVPIPASPLLQVLSAVIQEAAAASHPLGTDEQHAVEEAVLELAGGAIRAAVDHQPEHLRGQESLIRALMHDVTTNLSDPELSPAVLAQRHHISLRYVHSLFASTGTSCATYIRQRRLQAAARLLTNPRDLQTTVTDIGYRVGFSDPSTFIRAFKREYGGSPRDYRVAHQRSEVELATAGR